MTPAGHLDGPHRKATRSHPPGPAGKNHNKKRKEVSAAKGFQRPDGQQGRSPPREPRTFLSASCPPTSETLLPCAIHRSRRRCNELLPACSRNVSELRPGRFHQTSFCSALLQCVQVSASCAPPSCLLSLPSPPCYNQSERRRYKYVGLPFFYRPVVYRPNR